ncbi:unnamed protein product, partial [Meganyctiphanes norvegica]
MKNEFHSQEAYTHDEGEPECAKFLVGEGSTQEDKVFTDEKEADRSIAGYKPIHPKLQNTSIKEAREESQQDCCVFCLDDGDLIHICSCSMLTHKNCALQYISFPGSMNDRCCQCREKLKYKIQDRSTPMKHKYIIAFLFLVLVYCGMVGGSAYLTYLMIPVDSMDLWLYVFVVANLSILWPLILIFLVDMGLEVCLGPRDRRRVGSSGGSCCDGSGSHCGGCYCSGGCGDCNCDGGDDCVVIVIVCCLIAALIVLIAASVYIIMSLLKYYKCFVLKSKEEIVFEHENRKRN